MKFVIIIFLAIFSAGINADEMRPALIQIDQVDDSYYQILWKVPARGEMKLKLGLLIDGQQPPTNRESYFADGSYIERWQIKRTDGMPGLHIEVSQSNTKLTDTIIRYQSLKGEVVTGRINPQNPSFTFAKELHYENVFKTYTILGIEHILIGFDHLLFVACLVLIAGMNRKLFWAITGFTAAHSVTLIISALDIFSLPIAPLEAVIALSIIFLAVEIAKGNQTSLTYRYPVVVSSSFGLLHGFGFAAVLAEIGLPSQDFVSALLFFNIGVEIGQLLFIGAIILLMAVVLRSFKHFHIRLFEQASSYVIGSIAVFWCIERILVF